MTSKAVFRRIFGSIAPGLVIVAAIAVTKAQTSDSSKNSAEVKPGDETKITETKNQEEHEAAYVSAKQARKIYDVGIPSSDKYSFSDFTAEKVLMPKKQTTGSEWQFGFAPYLYATGLKGTLGARGRTIEIDASFGDVLENLDLGLMGTFEAKKGKWIFVNDLVWTKLGARRDSPGPLLSEAEIDVNLFILDPEVGYRVYESDRGSFDLLGGVRIWSVENRLNVADGLLPGFDVSERKTFAAPVIGFHGLINVCPKFYLSTKFDVGGRLGPDLTTQFYGGGGFRITQNVALIAGYRYLKVDYDDDTGFIFDTTMNGFLFGAKFSF